MPHNGWRAMAAPFIAAFKARAASPAAYITSDQLVYWYRPTPQSLDCDATDTTTTTTTVAANNASGNYFAGRPDGSATLADAVFVVAMLTAPGVVTVQSGTNTSAQQAFSAPAGVSAFRVDMHVGPQRFWLARDGATVLAARSLRDVADVCPCGIYNFNAYVGTVPPEEEEGKEGELDGLLADGLASLTVGLLVTTCVATPSLGTTVVVGGGVTLASTPLGTSASLGSRTTGFVTSTTTTMTASTLSISSSSTASSAASVATGTCNGGTGAGNYLELCDFACNFGTSPFSRCPRG